MLEERRVQKAKISLMRDAFKKLKANTSFNKDLVPKNQISWLQ